MALAISDRPSPNFDGRQGAVDMLLLHYTGMESTEAALGRLTDAAAKVSAHYLVDEEGRVFHLVAEECRAWHAGVSSWAGERDINSRAVGIELANPGHEFGYHDFPAPQIEALVGLAGDILERHPIPAHRVLGHSDVAPARKMDPGERFPWARLAEAGIGLYPPDGLAIGQDPPEVPSFLRDLARFGYDVGADGAPGAEADAAVTAFRRHFRPERLDGPPDGTDAARLAWLLEAGPSGP